jgi:hypothetical protein
MPALFTSKSSPPQCVRTQRTASATEASSRTSRTRVCTASVAAISCACASASLSASRAVMTTVAPDWASALAIAKPKPLDAPVISAFVPSNNEEVTIKNDFWDYKG